MNEELLEKIKQILKDFSAEEINELVANLKDIQQIGIQPGGIFPLGTVRPDGVYNATGIRIRSQSFDQQALDKIPSLLRNNNHIGQLNIFPLGIVAPEQFNADIDIKLP